MWYEKKWQWRCDMNIYESELTILTHADELQTSTKVSTRCFWSVHFLLMCKTMQTFCATDINTQQLDLCMHSLKPASSSEILLSLSDKKHLLCGKAWEKFKSRLGNHLNSFISMIVIRIIIRWLGILTFCSTKNNCTATVHFMKAFGYNQ